MNKVFSWIEGWDLFAVPVTFSFDGKGSEHRTLGGGCLSILVRMALVAYTVLLTNRMLKKEDNKNVSYDVKLNEFEAISLNESRTQLVFSLLNVTDDY